MSRYRRIVPYAIILAAYFANCAALLSFQFPSEHFSAWRHLPLDDAWIYLGIAKNLLHCGYITYNIGSIETGATSPLWVIVLAPILAIVRNPVVAARGLDVAFGATVLCLMWHELRGLGGRAAAYTGAFLLALEPMWAMGTCSGMDFPIAILLLFLLMRTVRNVQPIRSGLIMGAIILARPEMAPMCIAVGILSIIVAARRVNAQRAAAGWRTAWPCALATFLVAFPWFLYCRLGTGRWLPMPFYIKANGQTHLGPGSFYSLYKILSHNYWPSPFMHDPVCLALLIIGIVWLAARIIGFRQRPDMAAAYWLLVPLMHLAGWTLVTAPSNYDAHHGEYLTFYFTRYHIPDYPFVFAFMGMGAGVVATALARLGGRMKTHLTATHAQALRRSLAGAFVVLLVAGNAIGWWTFIGPMWAMGDGYVKSRHATAAYNYLASQEIDALQESAGRWIAVHIPQDVPILTEDTGGVRFFTKNLLVDPLGLESHEYFDAADKAAYLKSHGVKYAVIFPNTGVWDAIGLPTRTVKTFEGKPGVSVGSVYEVREILYGGIN